MVFLIFFSFGLGLKWNLSAITFHQICIFTKQEHHKQRCNRVTFHQICIFTKQEHHKQRCNRVTRAVSPKPPLMTTKDEDLVQEDWASTSRDRTREQERVATTESWECRERGWEWVESRERVREQMRSVLEFWLNQSIKLVKLYRSTVFPVESVVSGFSLFFLNFRFLQKTEPYQIPVRGWTG